MKTLNNFEKKTNPFKVPDNYFESLKVEVMDKLPENKPAKVVPLWRKFAPWVSIAAVSAGVLFYLGFFKPSSSNVKIADYALYEDDYLNFVEEQYEESAYKAMFFEDNY